MSRMKYILNLLHYVTKKRPFPSPIWVENRFYWKYPWTFVENSHSASVVCHGPSSDSHLCSVNPNIAAYICRNTCTQAYAFIYELPITDTIYRLKQKTWTKNLFHLPLLLFLVFFSDLSVSIKTSMQKVKILCNVLRGRRLCHTFSSPHLGPHKFNKYFSRFWGNCN